MLSVYLISMVGTELIKIGSSRDPTNHVQQMLECSASLPMEYAQAEGLSLLRSREYEQARDALIVEKRLQHLFSKQRTAGEWYKLNQNQVVKATEFIDSEHDIPPYSPRHNKTQEEQYEQQDLMFQAGVLAVENAQFRNDWPRVGKKYSAEWYRCKTAWLAGYDSTKDNLVLPSLNFDKTLEQRLTRKITERAPISRYSLIRMFSTADRSRVREIIDTWISQLALKTTGKGCKGSPVCITAINME